MYYISTDQIPYASEKCKNKDWIIYGNYPIPTLDKNRCINKWHTYPKVRY